jgi:hypothetical protein
MRIRWMALLAPLALFHCSSGGPCPGPSEDTSGEILCRGVCVGWGAYQAQGYCGSGDQCRICPDPGLPHTAPHCLGEACGWQCAAGYADCNQRADDGCETMIRGSDPDNCGGCGIHCHGECVQGFCNAHWDGEQNVAGLSMAPADGFAVDAESDRPLWTRWDGGTLDVRQGPLDGGPAETLASVPAGAGVPAALAVRDGQIYWSTGSALQADGGGGAIYRLARDRAGASPELIASGQDGPGALLVGARGLYWSNKLGGEIMYAPGGGAPRLLASGQARPGQLASDDADLYWVNEGRDGGDGSVAALPLDGGAPVILSIDSTLAGGTPSATARAPTGIAIVSEQEGLPPPSVQQFVVWADRPSGTVWAFLASGPPVAVTYGQSPWDPAQLFSGIETFSLYDRLAQRMENTSGIYIPGGGSEYEPPFGMVLAPPYQPYPPGTTAISPPFGAAFTDGGSVTFGYSASAP